MNERKLITKRDVFILAALLVLAVGLFLFFRFNQNDGKTALISIDGRDYMSVSLNENREINLDNGVKIVVSDGKIGFTESDCPDKVCVHTGMLSHDGDVAACVPNKTVITVLGEDTAVDSITY